MLGWPVHDDAADWATVVSPQEVVYLGFQASAEYVAPTWPPTSGAQQQMLHLDFEVHDLDAAVAAAQQAGARLAESQPQTAVRVLLDPDGHPFCLYLDPDVRDGPTAPPPPAT
jgi:catechol 2,3-dioxygenase-like lactoylglutathione lyase family enzyme